MNTDIVTLEEIEEVFADCIREMPVIQLNLSDLQRSILRS